MTAPGNATASIRAAAARKPRSPRMQRPDAATTALPGPSPTVAPPGRYHAYSPHVHPESGASCSGVTTHPARQRSVDGHWRLERSRWAD
jgi:hypothetical protein